MQFRIHVVLFACISCAAADSNSTAAETTEPPELKTTATVAPLTDNVSTAIQPDSNATTASSNATTPAEEDCIRIWVENWALVFIDFKLASDGPNNCPNGFEAQKWTAYFHGQFCIEIPRQAGLLFKRQVIFAPWYPISGDSPVNRDGYIKCPVGGHLTYADCIYKPTEGSNGTSIADRCGVSAVFK